LSILPSATWKAPCVPPAGRYNGSFSFGSLTEQVYGITTNGGIASEELEVCGPTIEDMAMTFTNMLGCAVDSGDFTNILSPECLFLM